MTSTKEINFMQVVEKAKAAALPSGLAGASAMGLNILSLMWLRTTVNYQYRYGGGALDALKTLYGQGGVVRFYRGLLPALVQGPLSRFGDTAANAGMMVALNEHPSTENLPTLVKSAICGFGAASWRVMLMPIDTLKTTLQTDGKQGITILKGRLAERGPVTLWRGAMGAATANYVGYFPWFATYNQMNVVLPETRHPTHQLLRSALMGFTASMVSDTCSNSIRVLKTYKQTHPDAGITYVDAAKQIVKKEGVVGVMGRGLRTKICANGMQGAMFAVLWKLLEPMMFRDKESPE